MARICMVVHEHYPKDFRVRREAEALTGAGHAVTVIALRAPGEPRRERCGSVDVHRLPVRRHRGSALPVYVAEYAAFFLLASWTLTARHLRSRFDVVYVHSPPDLLVFAALGPRLLGARVVLDVHDRVPELFAERFGGRPLVTFALLQFERAALRFASHVVTVHEPYAERLARRAPGTPITIVFNSADARLFPGVGELRSRRAGDPHPLRLLHHGTLMHRYGVDVLVEAMARLGAAAGDVRLDVLGDGDLLPRLRALVRRLRLEDRVLLHGHRPLEEIAGWIERADLCIVPNRRSPFTDGILPTKLLEYVAMGRPVIVTRTDAVSRYFTDDALYYVPPDDPQALVGAIEAFMRDPVPFERRARNALAAYAPLSWTGQAKRLQNLVCELAGPRSRA